MTTVHSDKACWEKEGFLFIEEKDTGYILSFKKENLLQIAYGTFLTYVFKDEI